MTDRRWTPIGVKHFIGNRVYRSEQHFGPWSNLENHEAIVGTDLLGAARSIPTETERETPIKPAVWTDHQTEKAREGATSPRSSQSKVVAPVSTDDLHPDREPFRRSAGSHNCARHAGPGSGRFHRAHPRS